MKIEAKIKRALNLTEDVRKSQTLIIEHLRPCSGDLVLITLKSHLIIENLLESILIRELDIERLPEEHALEFSQKLDLVKAVVIAREPKPNADLFCAIAKLNKIRNALAHNLLNQSEIEMAVKSIIQSYQSKADLKLNMGKSLPEQLEGCVLKLCKFLNEVLMHLFKLEMQTDP